MIEGFRSSLLIDGTPLQQSMIVDPATYADQRLYFPMVGVVLEVHPADSSDNRSAWQRVDHRGHQHEATVLILNDSMGGALMLPNVVILPPGPSGVSNYSEALPRPCRAFMSGGEADLNLQNVDPYDLDGDWCVVAFVGGNIDQPFIFSWWPHPRNTLDPATDGMGNPDSEGEGTTLIQAGRYFSRINGVEYTVTRKGDIYLSTRLASSSITPGEDPKLGRIARAESDTGGSVAINVKPGQILEVNFNPEVDGLGVYGSYEDDLPQTNPRETSQAPQRDNDKTIFHLDEEGVVATVPTEIRLESQDSCSISGSNSVTIEGNSVKLGENASDAVLKGSSFNAQLNVFLISLKAVFTAMKADPALSAASKTAVEAAEQAITTFMSNLDSLLSQKVTTE